MAISMSPLPETFVQGGFLIMISGKNNISLFCFTDL